MQLQDTQIHAGKLALSAGRGPVYGPLTFTLDGGLSVLRGDPGSGRTSLLLTLAGRMKHDAGSLTVGGLPLPRNLRSVQKATAIAGFAGIDELEQSVTVAAALRERRAWLSPWWKVVRTPNDVEVAALCADVFGAEPIPRADTVIWDLDETQHFLLRLTLALMSGPKMLFVDDVEQLRSGEARAAVWERLAHISRGSTAVVVSASTWDAQLWSELDIAPALVDLNESRARGAAEADTEETDADGPETAATDPAATSLLKELIP